MNTALQAHWILRLLGLGWVLRLGSVVTKKDAGEEGSVRCDVVQDC